MSGIPCAWCDQTAIGTALSYMSFDLVAHINRLKAFSEKTFGPGARTAGIIKHLGKELEEVEAAPSDLMEWIDVITLGIDGAWRSGHTAEQIAQALGAKLTENEQRQWPDWRTAPPDQPIEHIREVEHSKQDDPTPSSALTDEVLDMLEKVANEHFVDVSYNWDGYLAIIEAVTPIIEQQVRVALERKASEQPADLR